jgi:KDO2-lipid IV(A) lauroyltransferase
MNPKAIRHVIEYAAVRGALSVAGVLPIAAGHALGATLGAVAFDGLRIRRGVSVDNITRGLGVTPDEATRIARRAYRKMGKSLMEYASTRITLADLRDRIQVEGLEHLQEAHARGRGVVFVTAHQGNFEWMGAAVAAFGFPTDFVVGQQMNPRVDEVVNHMRSRHGIGIISKNFALRGVLRSLGKGRVIALIADQDARRHGVMVEFLGRPASTARGPALFAIRRRCPIVTGFLHREGTRHRAVINPPIEPPDLPEEDAVRVLTQAHADQLAAAIRAHPDEYFWPHRRWKTTRIESA